MSNQQADKARRDFLGKTAAAAATLSLAPGVTLINVAQARPLDQPVSNENRWGLLIDTNKCGDGCDACVTACQTENGWGAGSTDEKHSSPEQKAQWIRKVSLKNKLTGSAHDLPMMCQHCEHPPCVDVCPTGASFKRTDGIVLVDKHICIGCRYCMMACPYKARSFVHEALEDQNPDVPRGKGTVESCTLCVHKVDRGDGTTACAEACAKDGHKAIIFGDLNDPNSEISQEMKKQATTQIRADLNLNTGVRYRGI
jgi:molybdopterin-containing oxidoreductase family iron-sulfur binding subunit